jgi:SAM-dependent methyltransferase
MPFRAASFEEILCWEVLEHVEHKETLLAECHRVAAPGAKLVLSTPIRGVERFLAMLSHNYNASVLKTQHKFCQPYRSTLAQVREYFSVEAVWYAPEAFAYCLAVVLAMDRLGVLFNDAGDLVGPRVEQVDRIGRLFVKYTRPFFRIFSRLMPRWVTKSVCLQGRPLPLPEGSRIGLG